MTRATVAAQAVRYRRVGGTLTSGVLGGAHPQSPARPSLVTASSQLWVGGVANQTAPMTRDAQLARRLWSRLEPIHAVTYFSPEACAALANAGLQGILDGLLRGPGRADGSRRA